MRKGLLGDAGRSEKFRAFWSEVGFRCGADPQLCYVESHYQNFAEDVRRELAGLLAQPHVRDKDKEQIHKALCVQEILGANSQHTPVQLNKDSQQFAGDRFGSSRSPPLRQPRRAVAGPEAFEHNRNQALSS